MLIKIVTEKIEKKLPDWSKNTLQPCLARRIVEESLKNTSKKIFLSDLFSADADFQTQRNTALRCTILLFLLGFRVLFLRVGL